MTKALVRIITVTTLLTLAATAAHAGRKWKHLGSDGKNNHFLYDAKTTKRQGDVVSGWVSKQYNVDEKAMKEKNTPLNQYHGDTWTLAYYQFDCKQNKLRAVSGRQDITGKRVEDVPREEFHAAEPKSTDEAMLQAICKDVK